MDAKRKAAILAAAASIASGAEGLRQYAYYDPPGILTVCYGHTGEVVKGKKYSIPECLALLDKDMSHAIDQVEKCAPNAPDSVVIAFSDAVFNLGPTIACNTSKSTAARLLAGGYYRDACNQLPRWDKAKVGGVSVSLPGLTKRRALERDICLGDL